MTNRYLHAIAAASRIQNRIQNKLVEKQIEIRSRLRQSFDAIEYFENKIVTVIGPGESIDSDVLEKVLNSDVCILINKGYRLNWFQQIAGLSKNIVLFHCLDQREDVGGGAIDTLRLRDVGIQEVFLPLHYAGIHRDTARFHKNNVALLKLHRVKREYFNGIRREIGGFFPNTGTAAVCVASSAKGSRVHVHGITFYRTPYIENYADHLKDLSHTIKFIESYGVHNPDRDLEYLKRLMTTRNITVSPGMQKILDEPLSPLFYINSSDGLKRNIL